jgi:6-phosphogluconolactonase
MSEEPHLPPSDPDLKTFGSFMLNKSCPARTANHLLLSLLITVVSVITPPAQAETPHQYWAYIGNASNDGIALFKLDTDTGTLISAGIAAPARSPGFLAISPNQKFLFAAVSIKTPKASIGGVEGFSIDATTGKLTEINSQSAEGDGTAFVSIDPSGHNALAANYGSATVSVLPIDTAGNLSPATSVIQQTGSSIDPHRQTHAYAHSINCDPTGAFAIACDLGADKLFIYKLDAIAGKLIPNDPPSMAVPPGSGPRHLTFSRDGKFVYAVTEMGGSVIAYSFDPARGTLAEIQSITTLKNNEKGNTSAEVQLDPAGKFLYASNRLTTNYLTIFAVDPTNGKLALVGYQDSLGKTPRNFRIDPTGKYLLLANQDSDTLVLFAIDRQSGKLTPVGQPIPTVRSPSCVKFVAIQKP